MVSCRVSQTHPAPSGRKGKKDTASTAPRTPILEVILHDTIVFPEGGGQPSDTGLIQTVNKRVWKVLQARRHGGYAVHYVQIEDAEADSLHFAVGTKLLVKLGDADWDRRYDHVSVYDLLCRIRYGDTLSDADDYAHFSTPVVRCARGSTQHPDAILVVDGSTCSMLHRTIQKHDQR